MWFCLVACIQNEGGDYSMYLKTGKIFVGNTLTLTSKHRKTTIHTCLSACMQIYTNGEIELVH